MKIKNTKRIRTFAFIDAANIIYGTRDDGWKVDFRKLMKYLSERYQCKVVYYFAGIDKKNLKQTKFYNKLLSFGYKLILKPIKIYRQDNGNLIRKANCDVDLTFYAMKDIKLYKRIIFLSGDGDFEILLSYLIKLRKDVIIFANAKNTAREIKLLRKTQFNDLKVLSNIIHFEPKK